MKVEVLSELPSQHLRDDVLYSLRSLHTPLIPNVGFLNLDREKIAIDAHGRGL